MAFSSKSLLLLLFHLSFLLLSFCSNAFSDEFYDSAATLAQPPHHSSLPPAEAPKPHKGGHHHHHHHHKKVSPPTPPPAKPPIHTPSPPHPPPAKPPVHTPSPLHPPPVKPPVHTPSPPVKPPVHTPSPPHPPPPAPAPAHPPTHHPIVPIRKPIAVQGVVYCKSCKFSGIDTLFGATPLFNATVRLVCSNTKYHLVEKATTDKNGYFFMMPKIVTSSGSHKCQVSLLSSPNATCTKPTNLHGGLHGAILTTPVMKPPVTKPHPLPYELFTVGPFAFESIHHC